MLQNLKWVIDYCESSDRLTHNNKLSRSKVRILAVLRGVGE